MRPGARSRVQRRPVNLPSIIPRMTTTISDLLAWSDAFPVPKSMEGQLRKARFTADNLPAPAECSAEGIFAESAVRRVSGNAISIDSASLSAGRAGYRALGLVMLSYALSEQASPLRIHLAHADEGIAQIVLWPTAASKLERELGCSLGAREVHYRPAIPRDDPNYSTTEQDNAGYPREHLPYCSIGAPDTPREGVTRRGEPVCLHVAGTAPSLIWLGKFLLNLALEDSSCRLAYLYNYTPAESLAPGSAELRLVVTDS